jgi:hypothetical protein
MEDFQKELNILLNKYPDLPGFTLKVQPRVVIQPDITFTTEYHHSIPSANPQVTPVPLASTGTYVPPSHDIKSLESQVTSHKIREIQKANKE